MDLERVTQVDNHALLTYLLIFNRLRAIRPFHFGWDFPAAGEICGVFGKMTPKKSKCRKTLAERTLSHVKPRILSYRTWKSVHGYGLYAWLGHKNKKKVIKGTRPGFSPPRGGATADTIPTKRDRVVDPRDVITLG